MLLEDYLPNRLKAASKGINNFLSHKERCDIKMIVFAGEAKLLNETDPCSLIELTDSIGFNLKKGTSIGAAFWLAKDFLDITNFPKKLVIIGDGDNTYGFYPVQIIADVAKKSNIKVYSIGIGTTGSVPFGTDMVSNTFTDVDLKRIASLTGGQYYWAKDHHDVTRILAEIFN